MATYLVGIGLGIDIVGVVLMAIPILTTDVSVFGNWGQYKTQKEDAIKAKRWTLWGLSLIAFGFLLQIIALFQ